MNNAARPPSRCRVRAAALAASLLIAVPGVTVRAVPVPANGTTGEKRVLVVRLIFADMEGDPVVSLPKPGTPMEQEPVTLTREYVRRLFDDRVAPFFSKSSYGAVSLITTVTGLYKLSRPALTYAKSQASGFDIEQDVKPLISRDFNLSTYDRVVYVWPPLYDLPGSVAIARGSGSLGGTDVTINGQLTFAVAAHELGHTFGLRHAASWNSVDSDPLNPAGHVFNYGNVSDIMGSIVLEDNLTAEFMPSEKWQLGWITADNVQTVTKPGVYRVHSFTSDNANAKNQVIALKVKCAETEDYWVTLRGQYRTWGSTNIDRGATVTRDVTRRDPTNAWGYDSLLIDFNTPSSNQEDAALEVGQTFLDSAAGVSIKTVSLGGTGGDKYLDMEIRLPAPPEIAAAPADQVVLAGDAARFAVEVLSTLALSYRWESSADGQTWQPVQDGSGYSGSTGPHLAVTATAGVAHLRYRCVVTNSLGAATTPAALLTVVASPEIALQPFDQVALVGSDIVIATVALGAASFQWYGSTLGTEWVRLADDATCSGATTATLRLKAVAARNGSSFRCVVTNRLGSTTSAAARVTVADAITRFSNLSTRCWVGPGSSVGVVGFVLNHPATVLLRGIGPSLGTYGVDNVLRRPLLKVFDAQAKELARNSGWDAGAAQAALLRAAMGRVGAFTPSAREDAMLLLSLPAGLYTAHVLGSDDSSGNALLELFLDPVSRTADDQFLNLSSRIYVGTGASAGIAGFVMERPGTVLIRALGPTLANFGVDATLPAPVLTLRDGRGGVVRTNSGWKSDPAAVEAIRVAVTKLGATPLATGRDSAMLVSLPAGQYTVQLQGENETTGNGMIEVYLVR